MKTKIARVGEFLSYRLTNHLMSKSEIPVCPFRAAANKAEVWLWLL